MNKTLSSSQAVWTGDDFRSALAFASTLIHHHRERINQLNVFPVPDGDTGTNMALTMTGALDGLDELPADASAADVANKVAYGALMGARGNSGVILSQIFRGFATGIDGAAQLGGRELASGLAGARDTAYKAVMRPVEGTMLTVIRGAAEAAAESAQTHPGLLDVLRAALDGAQKALDGTPHQLETLRRAGVVDAGGQGVVYMLEGMMRSATGETALPASSEAHRDADDTDFSHLVAETHGEGAYGYCTNFMVFGTGIDSEGAREELSRMGDSAVIVGDDTMLKVHIHTIQPGEALQYALTLGELDQIKIDNMNRQTDALHHADAARARSVASDATEFLHGDLAIIAVAAGEGISGALRELGATSIVEGGQTMNPSTQELLAAVEASGAAKVILLPNNKNILMAANQVAELTDKTVRVVPTRSIPAALAALSAFNTDQDLDANVEDMTAGMADVHALAITRAVRDVELEGLSVASGQTIGLVNEELTTAGDDELDVVLQTFSHAEVEDLELVTIFTGENVEPQDAEALRDRLAETWPDAEIELHNGGQPHYRYIISAE